MNKFPVFRGRNSEANDEFFSEMERFMDGFFAPMLRATDTFSPAFEVTEGENGYLLSLDIPGVSPDNIHLEVKDSQLRVWGERKSEDTQSEGARKVSHRRYGRFERLFSLPSHVDEEHIEASYENGVLQLALPKAEKAKGRQIQIQKGEGKKNFWRNILGQATHSEDTKTVQ